MRFSLIGHQNFAVEFTPNNFRVFLDLLLVVYAHSERTKSARFSYTFAISQFQLSILKFLLVKRK